MLHQMPLVLLHKSSHPFLLAWQVLVSVAAVDSALVAVDSASAAAADLALAAVEDLAESIGNN